MKRQQENRVRLKLNVLIKMSREMLLSHQVVSRRGLESIIFLMIQFSIWRQPWIKPNKRLSRACNQIEAFLRVWEYYTAPFLSRYSLNWEFVSRKWRKYFENWNWCRKQKHSRKHKQSVTWFIISRRCLNKSCLFYSFVSRHLLYVCRW